jgi:hypothetical protein
MPDPDSAVSMLRHTVATLAYRAAKVLRDAPAEFAHFRASETTRTPEQILAHMGDLFDWALALADGRHVWHDSTALPWDEEVVRFFDAVKAFDQRLASGAPLGNNAGKLFSGPVADALAHTGQLAMLRRMFGSPVRGENYFKADIEIGHVGPDQAAPTLEFE